MNLLKLSDFEENINPELSIINNDLALISDIGRRKTTNEDYGKTGVREDGTIVMVVADGVSSSSSASFASKTATQVAFDILINSSLFSEDLVVQAINKANEKIKNLLTLLNPNKNLDKKAETTIVVVLRKKEKVITGWVGDSRVYIVGKSKVTQITEDDSWCNKMVKSGLMTLDEARKNNKSHVITQCLGLKRAIEIHTKSISLEEDEGIIACTDGLYNMTKIKPIKWDMPANIEAWFLVSAANKSGGFDNITIAINRP